MQRLQRLADTGDVDAAARLISWKMRLGLHPYFVRQAAALGLILVWIAVHCRLAAGDGSEAHQRQELEWQRQFLIRWLLS